MNFLRFKNFPQKSSWLKLKPENMICICFLRKGSPKQIKCNFFQIGLDPPPLKCKLVENIEKYFVPKTLSSSQNLKHPILVSKKAYLMPLVNFYTPFVKTNLKKN